jgi:hypothetical protein
MANNAQGKYVDADLIAVAIHNMNTHFTSYNNGYGSTNIDSQINGLINQAVNSALLQFKNNLASAIMMSARPYDKCMLCVQRDSCPPPDPRP